MHSFISAGGQLVTLADGTKQFNIVDNLGSVRCIVSWDGTNVSTQAFDYKPFGDLQSAGEENRIGYFGEQRDKESDYFAMGFRLYDPEIGRFLAIDPLLDIQPSQTPYHYCFNNPSSFTDPTGLYPEKEKGDKVLAQQTKVVRMEESEAMVIRDLAAPRTGDVLEEMKAMNKARWEAELWGLISEPRFNGTTNGGGTGSSGREGKKESENGAWAITNEWNDEYEKQFRDFAPTQAEKYKAEGRKFTCEDLALQVLIDFASQNNLPLVIDTGSEIFNASDSKWNGDLAGFTCELFGACGSDDLLLYNNTLKMNINEVQAGDLLIQVNESGRGHHTQIVESKTNSSIIIIQGDATREQFVGWSPNPCSIWGYMGYTITKGCFNRIDGSYKNVTYGNPYPKGFLNEFRARTWNFNNFNRR